MTHSGIIIKSTGSWYAVKDFNGNYTNCKIKGKLKNINFTTTNPVAVGDKVYFQHVPNENIGIITEIMPRTNYIIRKATKLSKSKQILAANIDVCVVIISLKQPKTSTGFVDRILATAESYHIPSIIVINKMDIYDRQDTKRISEIVSIYNNIGYKTFLTSAVNNYGIQELINFLTNKTSLFVGHSGVGKSAIVQAILPDEFIKTGDISFCHEKGKHTTTYANMYHIKDDSYIIDSPGIKEFGLTDMEKHEVASRFPEMRKYQNNCKFNNCIHIDEPNCAVKKAIEDGVISYERYKNYLSIINFIL